MPQYRTYNNDKLLCITVPELVKCGVSENTIWKQLQRQRQGQAFCWPHHKEGNTVYIHFDGLKDDYKKRIQQQLCGGVEPKEALKFDAIEERLQLKPEDRDVINEYKYGPAEKYLPASVAAQYKQALRVLNLIASYNKLTDIKLDLGYKSVSDFYKDIIDYCKLNDIPLPTSYTKLMERVRLYKVYGASVVISSHYGNQRTKKVRDEVSEALLIEMLSHHHQFEDTIISNQYNKYVQEHNLTGVNGKLLEITPQTVGNYRKKHDFQVISGRLGKDKWYDKYGPVTHRTRPTSPLVLVNADDNDLDLFFIADKRNSKGQIVKNYYHRVKLYVITDAVNGYPLGYACGEMNLELVYEAYRNAIRHIRELTGGYYALRQVVTDRWALKTLKPWLEEHTNFTPISLGNKRSNYAEASFSGRWHHILKLFKGYSGHNITSAKAIDRDAIEAEKRDFYSVDQAPEVVANFIEAIRHYVDPKTKRTKQQDWLNAWEKMPEADRMPLTDEKRLYCFGIRRPQLNEMTNNGIQFRVGADTHTYQLSLADYKTHVGKRGQVIYDPHDMTSIMFAVDDDNVKLIARPFDRIPAALHDQKEGDRKRLNAHLADKKALVKDLVSDKAERRMLLDRERLDAESLLQAGVIIKEVKQAAEQIALAPRASMVDDDEDIYDRLGKTDFVNQFRKRPEDEDE